MSFRARMDLSIQTEERFSFVDLAKLASKRAMAFSSRGMAKSLSALSHWVSRSHKKSSSPCASAARSVGIGAL